MTQTDMQKYIELEVYIMMDIKDPTCCQILHIPGLAMYPAKQAFFSNDDE